MTHNDFAWLDPEHTVTRITTTDGERVTVANNNPDGDGDVIFLAITDAEDAPEGVIVAIEASILRAAIDKAVGGDSEVPASKPYRPVDRDRLLRHIEDVEAALARRNERWEQDQETIRRLGAELELADKMREGQQAKTARELLDDTWEAAQVPADGQLRRDEFIISRHPISGYDTGYAPGPMPCKDGQWEHRLMDPRPVEPTPAEELADGLLATNEWLLSAEQTTRVAERMVADGWGKA